MGLEKIVKELNSEKKKQVKRVNNSLKIIKKYLCDTYSSRDLKEISPCQEKVNNFIDYVKQEFGIDIPTQKEKDERFKKQNSILMKVLQGYQVGQLIPKKDLSEKTGLNLRQLLGYAKGKNAFIKNDPKYKGYYQLIRPITKEQAAQTTGKIIGESGNVLNDHESYLKEKLASDKPHI